MVRMNLPLALYAPLTVTVWCAEYPAHRAMNMRPDERMHHVERFLCAAEVHDYIDMLGITVDQPRLSPGHYERSHIFRINVRRFSASRKEFVTFAVIRAYRPPTPPRVRIPALVDFYLHE